MAETTTKTLAELIAEAMANRDTTSTTSPEVRVVEGSTLQTKSNSGM